MLSRRKLLSLALPLGMLGGAYANNSVLGPLTPYGLPRKAWVNRPAIIRQECQQWCWAASIAMIFARYGHPINQQFIVEQTFGGLVCQPAPNTLTIAQNLSRQWTDANGVPFQSVVSAAYDFEGRINNLTNHYIVEQLSNDRPLLYCNRHHAMVLAVVDYYETPFGPNMYGAGVLDPWPWSPEFHYLTQAEWIAADLGGDMTFLATVHIQ